MIHPLATAFALTLSSLVAGLVVWAVLEPFLTQQTFGQVIKALLGQLQMGKAFLDMSGQLALGESILAGPFLGQNGVIACFAGIVSLALFVTILHRVSVNAYRQRFGCELSWRGSLLRQVCCLVLLPIIALACLAFLDVLLAAAEDAQPISNWFAPGIWLLPFLPAVILFISIYWLVLPNRLLGSNTLLAAVAATVCFFIWSVVVLGWFQSRIGAPEATGGLPRLFAALFGFWVSYAVGLYFAYLGHPAMRGPYEARSIGIGFSEQVAMALTIVGRLDGAQSADGYHAWLGKGALLRGLKAQRRDQQSVVDRLHGAGYLEQRSWGGAAQLQMNPADGSIADFFSLFGAEWPSHSRSRGLNAIRTLITPALDRPLSDLLRADNLRGGKAQALFAVPPTPKTLPSAAETDAFDAAKRAAEEIAALLDGEWAERRTKLADSQTEAVRVGAGSEETAQQTLTIAQVETARGREGWFDPQRGGREPRSPAGRSLNSGLDEIRAAVEQARNRT